jgi:hypothetical protein
VYTCYKNWKICTTVPLRLFINDERWPRQFYSLLLSVLVRQSICQYSGNSVDWIYYSIHFPPFHAEFILDSSQYISTTSRICTSVIELA